MVDNDSYFSWLLDLIFDGFKLDVSKYSDDEINDMYYEIFDKLKYRTEMSKYSPKFKTKKYLPKSINIGDQLSQNIGPYYPDRINTYVKYVEAQKYYGCYCDDWYIMNQSKDKLLDMLKNITDISNNLKIHINKKKKKILQIKNEVLFLQIKYKFTSDGKLIKRIKINKVISFRRKLKKLNNKYMND